MKVSCREDADPQAFINWLSFDGKPINVFLDGQKVDFAFAFDDEEGWVDRHKSKDGKAIIVGGCPVDERLFGEVTYKVWQWPAKPA